MAESKQDGGADRWFTDGLCFECQPDCGACCTNHEDYAYVYLDDDDLERLTGHLGLTPRLFNARYTQKEDGWRVLRMDAPDCPFLDGARCTVYGARPAQCRTFPFWDETLASRASWRRLRGFCPGIDRGPRHSLAVIQGHLADRSSE